MSSKDSRAICGLRPLPSEDSEPRRPNRISGIQLAEPVPESTYPLEAGLAGEYHAAVAESVLPEAPPQCFEPSNILERDAAVARPAPFNTLPNELLTSLFTSTAVREHSAFSAIVAISHTCRRWRDIALACPELWRRYVFLHTLKSGPRSPLFSQAMLDRCGDLALDVGWERVHEQYHRCRGHASSDHDSEELVYTDRSSSHLELNTVHRFRSYAVVYSPTLEPQVSLRHPLELRIPGLEELALDTSHLSANSILPFPQSFLDPKSTSLRSLQVRGPCWMDLNTIRSNNLRILEVAFHPGFRTNPWMIVDWIRMTRACPRLVKLGLVLTYSSVQDSAGDVETLTLLEAASTQRIRLPDLTELNLEAPTKFIEVFFPYFEYPSLRSLSLSPPGQSDTTPEVKDELLWEQVHRALLEMGKHTVDPVLKAQTSTQGLSSPPGEQLDQNPPSRHHRSRMQISSEPSGYFYMGFTLDSDVWVHSACSRLELEPVKVQFPWARNPVSSPRDWLELRIKHGLGVKFSELLESWSKILPPITEVRHDFKPPSSPVLNCIETFSEEQRARIVYGCI